MLRWCLGTLAWPRGRTQEVCNTGRAGTPVIGVFFTHPFPHRYGHNTVHHLGKTHSRKNYIALWCYYDGVLLRLFRSPLLY